MQERWIPSILIASVALTTAMGSQALGQSFQTCPRVLPSRIPGVEILATDPPTAGPGEVLVIRGKGFDLLPLDADAWFFSDATVMTALADLHVLDAKTALTIVPSHHLMKGSGYLAFDQTVTEDCGGVTGIGGGWLCHLVPFYIDDPTPYPRPVSRLTAVPVSEDTIELRWVDNSRNEDYFDVYYGARGRSSTTTYLGAVPADQRSEPINGLAPDTEYCFEVRAANASGAQRMPDLAKACARTYPKPPEAGELTITNVPGITNVMCPGRFTVELVAFRDTNRNGIVDPMGPVAVDHPAPAYPVIDIYHYPVWKIYVAKRYAPGADLIILANSVNHCGPGRPQFVALHVDSTRDRIVKVVAGDWWENTGPGREEIGAVMYNIDGVVGGASIVAGRVFGAASSLVQFFLDATIAGSPLTFHRGGELHLDFSQNGIEVRDG